MKKGDVWMPLYIGDYIASTTRLTTVQHGAYLLLLMDYWINGPPPDDNKQLQAITKCSPKIWIMVRQKVEHFFDISEGVWKHKRVEEEKLKAAQNIDKYRERSKKGNDAKRLKGLLEGADKVPSKVPPSPSPSPTPLKTKSKPKALAPEVELPAWLKQEVWDSWVEHRIEIRKAITPGAIKLTIEKLNKLRLEGNDPELVIKQSIIARYPDLYPVRNTQQRNKQYQSFADKDRDYANRLTGRTGGDDGHFIFDAE